MSKVVLPRMQPNRVHRSGLIDQIEQNAWRKLFLICAPAGFGKTTILRGWAESSHRSFCYLLLDEGDNLPHTFLFYLVASIRARYPQFGPSLETWNSLPALPPPLEMAAHLVNELTQLQEEIYLALDDFQVIHNQYNLSLTAELIRHLPELIHVIIVTREEPPFSLASMRARNDLCELRMNDLRFSKDEAADFLIDKMQLQLQPDQIDLLLKRTEGWAAGMQLAALSIRETPSVDTMLHNLNGSNRYILDFLLQEVLAGIDEPTRDFLLRCSLLEKMCQPLCRAICADMPVIPDLADLESANLFITNLDQDRVWYRLHSLFAESLRFQLQKEKCPDFIRTIYRLAGDWEKDAGFYPESVRHYILSGDLLAAGEIAGIHAATLLSRAEAAHCIEWLDQLPTAVTDENFGIQLVYGYGLISIGHPEKIPPHLVRAQNLFDHFSAYLDNVNRNELQARIHATQALLASGTGEIEETIRLADLALAYLPVEDAVRTSVLLAKAIAFHNCGNIRQAAHLLEETLLNPHQSEQNQIHLVVLYNLAINQIELGEFKLGFQTLQQAEDFCRTYLSEVESFMAVVYHGYAIYWYEKNELKRAAEMAARCIDLIPRWGNVDIHYGALLLRAQIDLAEGKFSEAERQLQAVDQLLQKSGSRQIIRDMWMELRLHLAVESGDLRIAEEPPGGMWNNLERATPFLAQSLRLTKCYAELLLKGNLSEETVAYLEQMASGAMGDRLADSLLAQLFLLATRSDPAHPVSPAELDQVITQMRTAGFCRLLMDHAAVFRNLILPVVHQLDLQNQSYLSWMEGESVRTASPVRIEEVERLSEREVEVLRYLQAGLSNAEIGRRMVITTGTVKRHLHNIFQKLGVDNRLAAISQARNAGYLPE